MFKCDGIEGGKSKEPVAECLSLFNNQCQNRHADIPVHFRNLKHHPSFKKIAGNVELDRFVSFVQVSKTASVSKATDETFLNSDENR